MSKTVISIKVSELPQSVLKQLLHYCGSESLEAEQDSTSENPQSIYFLYNYDIELSRGQSDALVAAASKQDIEDEIARREARKEQERQRNAKTKRNESTRKKAPKPEAPQAGGTALGGSPERT